MAEERTLRGLLPPREERERLKREHLADMDRLRELLEGTEPGAVLAAYCLQEGEDGLGD